MPCVYHFYLRPPVLVHGGRVPLRRHTSTAGVTVMNADFNPAIIEPAIEQLRIAVHTVYLTEPVLELARGRGTRPARVVGAASGSEANEGAMMLATLATGSREFRLYFDVGRASAPRRHQRHR